MSNELTVDKFINSINSNDISYMTFNKSERPAYKKFYVESSDDAEFYGFFLARLYKIPQLTQCFGCNGKEEVLKKYLNYQGGNAGFIVDKDYLPIDKKYNDVIQTTGYSMENFYFYYNEEDSKAFNYESIFEHFYTNNKLNDALIRYKDHLIIYKERYLSYFAFFKTCMEFSRGYTKYNQHIIVKKSVDDKNNSKEDIDELIDKLINDLNDNVKEIFKSKYLDNKVLLNNNDFMLFRGHDIFDDLVEFLRNDGINVKYSELRKLSYKMMIPKDFEAKLIVL